MKIFALCTFATDAGSSFTGVGVVEANRQTLWEARAGDPELSTLVCNGVRLADIARRPGTEEIDPIVRICKRGKGKGYSMGASFAPVKILAVSNGHQVSMTFLGTVLSPFSAVFQTDC